MATPKIARVRTLLTTRSGVTVSVTRSARTGTYAIELERQRRDGRLQRMVISDREVSAVVDAVCDAADLLDELTGEVAAE